MILVLLLILVEVLSLVVLRQHLFKLNRVIYYVSVLIHIILSIWFWILVISLIDHNTFFDTPGNIWRLTAFVGMLFAVIFPRILLIILHFSGMWMRREKGGHIKWMTYTGLAISAITLAVTAWGTMVERFNFKYEVVPIEISGLHPDLEDLKIVHISDIHLPGFYHHSDRLKEVIEEINDLNPDLIFNTGDFITFGWREFGRTDTILSRSESRYGNYAVIGNHDAGTYHPEYTDADLENHRLVINNLIKASGYRVLNDEFTKIRIGNAVLGIIGVTTGGRHPDIIHGDINKAVSGLDSTDLNILLTHDPNHWLEEIRGKYPEIKLSLSGHTHGMQMGIMTGKFRWSPSKYFYPHWNGLYPDDGQYHYVNRGLGVLAIPFRIWMPPEITIITLHSENRKTGSSTPRLF